MASQYAASARARGGSQATPSPSRSTARSSHVGQNGQTPTRRTQAARKSAGHDAERHRYRVGVLPLTEEAQTAKDDGRAVVWLDIDNTLYRKSTRIAEMMSQRIRTYILGLGLGQEEAEQLHRRYYKQYGLAIRGLVMHQKIDALDYDAKCDATLPLDDILTPDEDVIGLLTDLDRTKCRVWALTNAYKTHALRVLRLLHLDKLVEGMVYCDYAMPNFACKPEVDFYLGALHCVGMSDAARCYFVDDSLLNIRAAKELGWRSCVLFKEQEEEQVVSKVEENKSNVVSNGGSLADFESGLPSAYGDLDEERIRSAVKELPQERRLKLLRIVLQACSPGDVASMRKLLDQDARSDGRHCDLPQNVLHIVFEKLGVSDLLRCRRVARAWQEASRDAALWQAHALALTVGEQDESFPHVEITDWETRVKALIRRERNWARGLCQGIRQMPGHSGFVTAMKLKGRSTLVSGSYDETIRVWDLADGTCKKVLRAKAIACLDFLADEAILAAGLYDSGRIMIWDMNTWSLLQTLSGHNHGIRNVAMNEDYLVSVGQDKAIVVWDWRSGTKVVRFGQQSNVSLGVSIVDHDKVVAVTVDGIVRTFDISPGKREMIGQFDLAKLAPALGPRLAGLKDGSTMMQWFAAHRNTITIGSSAFVVHLQWREHAVPRVNTSRSPSSSSDASQPARRSPSTARKSISSLTKSSSARTVSQSRGFDGVGDTVQSAAPTGKLATAATKASVEALNRDQASTRIAPDLSAAPIVLGIVDVTDGAVGAVDAIKKRIVCSPRFSSRAGADRRLYTTTFSSEGGVGQGGVGRGWIGQGWIGQGGVGQGWVGHEGDGQDGIGQGGALTGRPPAVIPIGGAWQESAREMAVPDRNPMSIVLDGSHCVVGTSEGLIYSMTFAGSEYGPDDLSAKQEANKDGDATIANLVELRDHWPELFVQRKSS